MDATWTHRDDGFVIGLLTGACVGAGLAIWLAPRLASALRQRVFDSARNLDRARPSSVVSRRRTVNVLTTVCVRRLALQWISALMTRRIGNGNRRGLLRRGVPDWSAASHGKRHGAHAERHPARPQATDGGAAAQAEHHVRSIHLAHADPQHPNRRGPDRSALQLQRENGWRAHCSCWRATGSRPYQCAWCRNLTRYARRDGGTTRSRVSFFLNKFKKLGVIEYSGELPIKINNSLLSVVLLDCGAPRSPSPSLTCS